MGAITNASRLMPIIANVFLLAVLFPFVAVIPLPFDTQPYALLLSVFILCGFLASGRLCLPRTLWLLLLPGLYAVSIFLFFKGSEFGAIRSVAGYVSVFVVSAAAYKMIRYINPNVFVLSTFIWFSFGLLQTIWDKGFGSWLVPRATTGLARGAGAASLAPEPSLYAVTCTFFLLFNEVFYVHGGYSRRRYLIVLLLLAIQIVWSFSALGILLLLAFGVAKGIVLLSSLRAQRGGLFGIVLLGVSCGLVWIFFAENYMKETRAGRLLALVWSNQGAVLLDGSIADRLMHMVLPFYGFVSSYGVGLGLATWAIEGKRLAPQLDWGSGQIFHHQYVNFGDRIMSGWGTAVFELGVIGLFLIIVVFLVFIGKAIREKERRGSHLTVLFLIWVLMLSAVPLATPAFAFLLGVDARSGDIFEKFHMRPKRLRFQLVAHRNRWREEWATGQSKRRNA